MNHSLDRHFVWSRNTEAELHGRPEAMEFGAFFDLHDAISRWWTVPEVDVGLKEFLDALQEHFEHAEAATQAFSREKSVVTSQAGLLQGSEGRCFKFYSNFANNDVPLDFFEFQL